MKITMKVINRALINSEVIDKLNVIPELIKGLLISEGTDMDFYYVIILLIIFW